MRRCLRFFDIDLLLMLPLLQHCRYMRYFSRYYDACYLFYECHIITRAVTVLNAR